MINISFDNPLLLILLIPMLALVLVPYFIAIRKENKSRASTVALVLHLVIVFLVICAAAGMSNVTVITETELYVLADVSESMDGKLDLVDEYIARVEDELPRNSEMGVITFGKNYRLHTPMGGEITSVKANKVNSSATDIASAIRYADSLFKDSSIKRIVLITDGMSTDPDEAKQLVRVVEDLKARGVYTPALQTLLQGIRREWGYYRQPSSLSLRQPNPSKHRHKNAGPPLEGEQISASCKANAFMTA